jgi:hypothetical protein
MANTFDISKIPPEELARMPSRVPPPGIVPNLVDPYTIGNYIVTTTTVLMSIMMVFLTLRFYVVFNIKKKMAPDDWAVVAGSLGCYYYFIVTCICKVALSEGQAILQLTRAQAIIVMKYGTHMWDLSIPDVWSRDAATVSCVPKNTTYETYLRCRSASWRTVLGILSGLASRLRSSSCTSNSFVLLHGFAAAYTSVSL